MKNLAAILAQYGLALVFANVLVEQLGVPVPAVPTLIVAGALAAEGKLALAAILAVAVLACMISDGLWYFAGRRYGLRVLRLLCRISLSPDSCVRQAENQFERWGMVGLVLGKFIPGVATVAPPLAGAMKVGAVRYLFFNTLGTLLWAGVAIGAGFAFHRQVAVVVGVVEEFGARAGVVAGTLLAAYIMLKWWERRRFYRAMRVARISVDELHRLMQGDKPPVVVDVRAESERKVDARYIPGALPIDLAALDARRHELPDGREIVFYCNCPNEASAALAAKQLMSLGYTRVRPLLGGLEEWVKTGFEIEERGAGGMGDVALR